MERQTTPRFKRLTLVLLWLSGAGIAAYWLSFSTSGEIRATTAPCYLAVERNFVLPDGFVALGAVTTAVLLQRDSPAAVLSGALTAGGFLFLGLTDIAYNLWNDMYLHPTGAMGVEVAINVFCMSFPVWLTAFIWANRRRLIY